MELGFIKEFIHWCLTMVNVDGGRFEAEVAGKQAHGTFPRVGNLAQDEDLRDGYQSTREIIAVERQEFAYHFMHQDAEPVSELFNSYMTGHVNNPGIF